MTEPEKDEYLYSPVASQVLAALDRHPRNKRPSAEWRLVLVTGAADVRLELL